MVYSEVVRLLVRATNWVGDAVMSLPALAALRRRFPGAHIAILARPWVAGLYRHETFADEIIAYQPGRLWRGWKDRRTAAAALAEMQFDCAVLLQNAFDAALVTWLAHVPRRIGYARDGRGPLLTDAFRPPPKGSIPSHQSYYYLELIRLAGWLDQMPAEPLIRLEGAPRARQAGQERFHGEGTGKVIGVSPGAAYGTAKRWWPERFAAAASRLAGETGASVALFGSPTERELCEAVAGQIRRNGLDVHNFAGRTSLEEYIERAAACFAYLTNDSGAMHIASALGVPTVAVFGATNHVATGPTGPLARVIRRDVDCSPCLLRHCPLDHRCMTAVSPDMVADAALHLLQLR
ncbi:MAG TPA: lipopolysaccharide heptosyltransferase II [Bryobacteraceae bacterium]|nr:lipopolysaccharide heptosyltransferase II [Bryobacteraceae bacterium]